MQNVSSLASTQMDLDTFLKKISEFFRKTLEQIQKIPNLSILFVSYFIFSQAKHVHAKLQTSSFYSDGLRQIFDHF
jgi:hypothetical protein